MSSTLYKRDNMTLEILFDKYHKIEKLHRYEYKRYFHQVVDFSDKMVGILGSRGAGKTTFILQHLQALDIETHKKLYFSADSITLADVSLYEIADSFAKVGGEVLAIDEIHKYVRKKDSSPQMKWDMREW